MARFLLLLLLPFLSRSAETNCSNQTPVQSHYADGVSATHLVKGLTKGGKAVGGKEVIEMINLVLNNLPLTKFLRDQKAEINEIMERMTAEAAVYVEILGEEYKDYLDRLIKHINASEQVAARLISLAVTSWMNCGVNAEDILGYGYTQVAQKQFAKFLEAAIVDSKDITLRLEAIKTELDILKSDAQVQQKLIKQYFEAQIARMEQEKKDGKKLLWICLIPIACPIVIATTASAVNSANEHIDYMEKVSADCIANFEDAEYQTDEAICLMQDWLPASRNLTDALEKTATDNDLLLPILTEGYIAENPSEAGKYNSYLVRLFDDMIGLQLACEAVEGFDMNVVKDFNGKSVPKYPSQPKVCACLDIKDLDQWINSKNCKDGAGEAIYDDFLISKGFPLGFIGRNGYNQILKEFLTNEEVCTVNPVSSDKTEL